MKMYLIMGRRACDDVSGRSSFVVLATRKEGNVLFNDALNTFYFTVIWRHTYGKGPLRFRGRKPAAATWATLSE